MEPWPLECTVFFSNAAYRTTATCLRQLFARVGEVQCVELYKSSRGNFIGAGVVTFLSPSSASRAVTELDGSDVHGRPIRVKPNERRLRGQGRRNHVETTKAKAKR
ncbi:unnamed protein product [Symbiodinium sp. CCMP2592]|nr:unnamed protein product [Symbiodinium sp. CCMP2592]